MENKIRNSGFIKILLAVILWSLFPFYKIMTGLSDQSLDDPIIGILRFCAFIGGFCFLGYGLIQIGKSRKLSKADPVLLEKKSNTGLILMLISFFVGVAVFLIAISGNPEKDYNVLGVIWGLSIITTLWGLVSIRGSSVSKIMYLILIICSYAGMVYWGLITSIKNWHW